MLIDAADLKRCGMCKEHKPRSEFHRMTKAKDGLHSRCRPCSAIARAAHKAKTLAADPEAFKAKQKVYRATYQAKHPDRIRAGWRKQNLKKFGITPDEFDAMKVTQQGVCAICGDPPPEFRDLAVDHCHSTGRVRGLLCGRCNTAIGLLHDDVTLARAVIDYLERGSSDASGIDGVRLVG